MIHTVANNIVSDPCDPLFTSEHSSASTVYVPPLPKPVIEAAAPVQSREVIVIDIVSTIKTLAAIGALWLLGSALLALATLFLHIVMPIIFGLLVLAVLSVALKNTRAGNLLQQLFCQNKQPAPKPVSVRVENGDS